MGIPHFQNHWLKDSTIGPVLASLVLSQFLVNIPAKGRKNSIPCAHVQSLSHVQLFVTPQTVAHQAPLSMGLSRQEYWSELPFLLQGSSWSRDWTCVSCIFCTGRWILYHWTTWEAQFPSNTIGLSSRHTKMSFNLAPLTAKLQAHLPLNMFSDSVGSLASTCHHRSALSWVLLTGCQPYDYIWRTTYVSMHLSLSLIWYES